MNFLINTSELLKVINNKNIKIIDVRMPEDFIQGHIPNSINIPEIFTYLPEGLTTKKEKQDFIDFFVEKFSNCGISKDDDIIFYEEKYTLKSPRGIGILKYLGHEESKMKVLEGGYELWVEGDNEVTKIAKKKDYQQYIVDVNESFYLDYNDMLEAIDDEKIIILDVRDKDEWVGISSSPYGIDYAPKKGRLPNAIWMEWYDFITTDMLRVNNLKQIQEELLEKNILIDANIVLYCFKGARLSNSYIALRELGYENIRMYFAGWNEWCRIEGAPIINETLDFENPLFKENMELKHKIDSLQKANSKLISFPKYNKQPIFAFDRDGNIHNDNQATRDVLPSIKKYSDLFPNCEKKDLYNMIDNNHEDKIVVHDLDEYYELNLKGSREVNSVLVYGFNISELKQLNEHLEDTVNQRTKSLEEVNKNLHDNINYAALIQEAVLPTAISFEKNFSDHFVFWKPCDTVGGDIYFATYFGENDEETLIMLMDGAGHSISGALLTMLIKAIETKVVANVLSGKIPCEANEILEKFNYYFKKMMDQKDDKAQIGFDGCVLYYNKKTNICKYAGAKIPLLIIEDGELSEIKSDRKSIGFKRNKINQNFKNNTFKVKEGTQIFMFSDGIIDQGNHKNEFFGKEKFKQILLDNKDKSSLDIKNTIISELNNFKKEKVQIDDITIIGLKI